MYINNSIPSPSFGSIKILKGGEDFLKQNSIKDFEVIMKEKDNFSHTKWELGIGEDGYIFTNPELRKTYTGPFIIKRHIRKRYLNPNLSSPRILINMKDKEKTICYSRACKDDLSMEQVYLIVKRSKGAEKILNIFKILESECINLIEQGNKLIIK